MPFSPDNDNLRSLLDRGETVRLECKAARGGLPVDIGERSGSGLCNLYAVWRKSGQPVPTLREGFDPDRTTLEIDFERAAESPSGQGTISRTESGPESGPESWPESWPKSNENKILSLVWFGEMAKRELAAKLKVSPDSNSLESAIISLFSSGLMERTIPDKPHSRFRKYRLTDKGRAAFATRTVKS